MVDAGVGASEQSSGGAQCIFTRRIAIFGDVFVYFFTDVGISFMSEKKEEK